MAKPQEHSLAKRLRKLAAHAAGQGQSADAANFTMAAHQLDLTIQSLGIWRDPERIKSTAAFKQAERYHDEYVRHHPGARV